MKIRQTNKQNTTGNKRTFCSRIHVARVCACVNCYRCCFHSCIQIEQKKVWPFLNSRTIFFWLKKCPLSTFCAQRRNFPLRFHFSFYYVVVFGCHFFTFAINCFVFTHSTRLQQTKNQIQKINCWFIASVWFNILFATFFSSFLRKLTSVCEHERTWISYRIAVFIVHSQSNKPFACILCNRCLYDPAKNSTKHHIKRKCINFFGANQILELL